ncbi:unnamed protein product [Moneuplotes crassus]|uniref:Uncharacterized protein n=1 Tax=Euplotes crassus TaxID=5936 RepID=A0AAD1XJ57_EUPCR|nr:unnamed protein product [Moneuplotes crassus]
MQAKRTTRDLLRGRNGTVYTGIVNWYTRCRARTSEDFLIVIKNCNQAKNSQDIFAGS